MLISNLSYLLGAKVLKSASMQAVTSFCTKLVLPCSAYFATCEESAFLAGKEGAYVIITQFKPKEFFPETFYFQVPCLKAAMQALLKFKACEKKLSVLYGEDLLLAPAFGVGILQNDLFKDLDVLLNAKDKSVFLAREKSYALAFSTPYEKKDLSFELINFKDFSCTLSIDGDFYSLPLPKEYAKGLLSFIKALKAYRINLPYKPEKITALKLIYVNEYNHPVPSSDRAFVVVNEALFKHLKDKKGLKVAGKDFFYENLEELRLLKSFRYALVCEDASSLSEALKASFKSPTLF